MKRVILLRNGIISYPSFASFLTATWGILYSTILAYLAFSGDDSWLGWPLCYVDVGFPSRNSFIVE